MRREKNSVTSRQIRKLEKHMQKERISGAFSVNLAVLD